MGKIHYFYGNFQVRKLLVYQAGYQPWANHPFTKLSQKKRLRMAEACPRARGPSRWVTHPNGELRERLEAMALIEIDALSNLIAWWFSSSRC